MPDENEKIIQEQFKRLPKDVQNAVLSPDFDRNLEFIRNRHGLLVDKATPLQNETLLLMLGMIPLEEFPGNLSESLGIKPEEAIVLAKDIDRAIITPIRSSLIAFGNAQNTESPSVSKSTPIVEKKEPTIPPNLPRVQPGSQSMPKTEEPFLPMLVKKPSSIPLSTPQNTMPSSGIPAPKPITLPQTPRIEPKIATTEKPQRIETPAQKKIPEVTSALAAEISNLLGKQGSQVGNASAIPPTTKTAMPSITTPTPIQNQQKPPAPPQPTPTAPQIKMPSVEPPVEASQQPNRSPITLGNKMDTVTQKLKTEVEMVRATTPAPEKKPASDPYREAIE